MKLSFLFGSRFHAVASRRRRRTSSKMRSSCRLTLEQLEDRTTPSVAVLDSFAGLSVLDGLYDPPDPSVAAGPGHIVEVVNTAIAVYDKSDGRLLLRQTLDTRNSTNPFFKPLNPGNEVVAPLTTYDELAGRFVVAALDLERITNLGGNTTFQVKGLLYAVSNTSNPLDGFAEMQRITFGPNQWFDAMPQIGWNADAHVLTLPLFVPPPGETDPRLAADLNVFVVSIDKSTTLDKNSATFTSFQTVRDEEANEMAPAVMHGARPGDPMWFVHVGPVRSGSAIYVERMEGVLTPQPTFVPTPVPVEPYFVGSPAPQKDGGTVTLDAGDPGIYTAAWRNGRLVAAHTIDVSELIFADLGARNYVRWYEFDTSGLAPTLVQQGTLDPGPGIHTFFSSLALAPDGAVGMTFLQSSENEYLSMYVTGRTTDDPLGVMRAPVLVKAGERRISAFTGIPALVGRRSAIAVDPVTGQFWAVNEYAKDAGQSFYNWGTWIANFGVGLPTISISDGAVTEGNSGSVNATFTVTLSKPLNQAVTVNFATANGTATAGSDYTAASGDLTFAAGEVAKTITVAARGDTTFEPDETFFVNLSNPSGAGIGDSQGAGVIANDDSRPTVRVNDVVRKEGNRGRIAFTFTVTLSNASYETITVNYATSDGSAKAGSDYEAASGTLTFAPGETSKTVTVWVFGDKIKEDDEIFFLNLSGVTNALLEDEQGIGTIRNDEKR